MTTSPSLDVWRPALVGVLQTSSERDHNSEAGIESFLDLPLKWIDCEFYDEHSVAKFYDGVADRRFSAVCFGSNALFNPAIHGASCDAADEVAQASEDGMGLVLLQQFLPEGWRRACDFLPAFHQLEYNGLGYHRIERIDVADRVLDPGPALSLDALTFGSREPVLWSTITASHPRAWRTLATVTANGSKHVAFMRTRTSRSRVIASALPLDWMSDRRLLTYAIGLSVRSLGTLYVHSGRERQLSISLELLLGRSLAKGGHLTAVTVDDPGMVSSRGSPFAHFAHIVVADEWGWPELTGLYQERIRARLENGGSVSAFGSAADSSGERVLSIVRGRPIYLQLAHQFAAWFEANLARFLDAPTTAVRALAVAVRAVHDSMVDEDEIPRSVAIGEIDRLLGPYFRSRLNGSDNVDGHVLPTASVASAMLLLDHPSDDITPLRRWIERGQYVSSFAAVQQAALWLPGVRVPDGDAATGDLEMIYERLLAVRAGSADAAQLEELLDILRDPAAQVSRKAIIAESLAASGGPETLVRAAGAARQLHNDLDLALSAEHAPLEVICLLTAFLVRLHAAQEATAGYAVVDGHPGEHTINLEADLRQDLGEARQNVESLQQKLDSAQEELDATRSFGAKAVGWAVVIALLFTFAGCWFLVTRVDTEWPAWAAVFAPLSGVVGAVVLFVGYRAGKMECEPRALSAVREVFRR